MEQIDTLIIGAGCAGLGCAYGLEKAGRKVVIFEKQEFPGGRMITRNVGGGEFNPGAGFILKGYKNLYSLAKELGVKIYPYQRQKLGILKDGKVEVFNARQTIGLIKYSGLSLITKLRIAITGPFLVIQSLFLDPYNLRKSLKYDGITMYSWLKRFWGREAIDSFMDPITRGLFAYGTKDITKGVVLPVLHLSVNIEYQVFEGGVGALMKALSDKFDVRYGVTVHSVSRQEDRVEVEFEQKNMHQTIQVKNVVFAVPGDKVLSMLKNPKEYESSFLKQVKYSKACTFIGQATSKDAFEDLQYIVFTEQQNRSLVNLQMSPTRSANTLALGGTLSLPDLVSYDEETLTKNIMNEVTSALPQVEKYSILDMQYWDSAIPKFPVGYLNSLYNFLDHNLDDKQISFCGDYIAGPYTEAAFCSGLQVAKRLSEH